MIHHHAALQIFSDVWAEYSALVESEDHSTAATNFILDVQAAVRFLYPTSIAYTKVHDALIDAPSRIYPATRAALGTHFLKAELWPVRNYFNSTGK